MGFINLCFVRYATGRGHRNAAHSSNHLSLLAGLVTTLFLSSGCKSFDQTGSSSTRNSAVAAATVRTKQAQAAMSPQAALAELRAGNARFAEGHSQVRNFLAEVRATASGQYPFAVILSCLDSRQPIEIVFDQGVGDVFSARIAGNVLNEDILGSMEFACKVSGAKLIAVIGHSSCGAIKGAIDDVQLGNLTGLLARVKPAIAQASDKGQSETKNDDFVQKVAQANVLLVTRQIREKSSILREMLDAGTITLVGGMYDLSTGKVTFLPN